MELSYLFLMSGGWNLSGNLLDQCESFSRMKLTWILEQLWWLKQDIEQNYIRTVLSLLQFPFLSFISFGSKTFACSELVETLHQWAIGAITVYIDMKQVSLVISPYLCCLQLYFYDKLNLSLSFCINMFIYGNQIFIEVDSLL